jgi:hypothetical protein
MASELVSFDEAARLLRMTSQQLQEVVSRRELSTMLGSVPRFRMDQIERYADEHGITLAAPGEEVSFGDPTMEFESGEVELDNDIGGDSSSSILVSEVALGGAKGPSSTVIGDDQIAGGQDSDLVLAPESELKEESSSLRLTVPPPGGSNVKSDSGIKTATDSDLALIAAQRAKEEAEPAGHESDLKLAADSAASTGSDVEPTDSDLEKIGGSDLELTGDSDLDLGAEVLAGAGESDLLLAGASGITPGDTGRLDTRGKSSDLEFATDDLDIDVTDSGSALDLGDEELVLDGESALDGDIALAGDSGINIGKPSDSGIDLANADESGISVAPKGDSGFMLEDEDAMQLEGGSSADSLALPEDIDVVSLEEELTDPDAATQLKSDEDFDLTPVEGAVEDESDSGSQVIALDTEALDADAATQLGGPPGFAPIDMEPVESVITEEPADAGFAETLPAGQQPGLVTAPYAQQPQFPTQELPEAPYTGWQVGSLAIVALMLAFAGILMMDVVRNIWSFNEPYGASTSIMNSIVSALGV